MGSVMSLSCSKRKASSQDVESESVKRRKICSSTTNLIPTPPDELSWKHPLSLCANIVVNVTATVFTKFIFQQDNVDTKSSALLHPSPPTSVSQNWKHHVFPSFHGPDVRRTFLSHILVVFKKMGIDPFIDNNIPRSKSIDPELKDAIRGSKIAIVLLSKNYASSSWCLDELAEIMNCREVLGQIVMTIFYEVDPTDVKKQTGDFGKAFQQSCKGKTKERIKRWRKALEDVAKIAGYHSHKWVNEAAMIEKIANDVSNMLNSFTPSKDVDGLVGMRAHMFRMEQLLRLDLDEVRMIGIWGPPGIGKTTIARVLLNQVSNRFQLSAIIVNIKGCYPRPCLDEYSAQLQLQKQMLSEVINQKDITISHLGVAQERLKDKKVFLVLDEVDHLGQLDALAKETQWFGPGSRIIITTEDLRVLKAHTINHVYKVKFPSSSMAFQIFCMHAFRKNHPDDGFSKLAWEVTALAGKLPLGLKVLGSTLRGMSKQEWERIVPRLKTRLDGEIESIIKFSYDALNDEDKCLFLYLACFFIYEQVHIVEAILANKFFDVTQGLHVLAERSLISIERNVIKIHTLLETFGRETSRKQLVHHGFSKDQLLVDARHICEVLSGGTTDNRRFIGINLDLSKTKEELDISEKVFERMHDFQLVRINDNYVDNSEILQSLLYHSHKIRLLDWSCFKNICLPSTFNPEFLVKLVMPYSKLQKLWEGTKQLKSLRLMDLRNSTNLKKLPDLSTATNLEQLNLRRCSSLVKLLSSINAPNLGRVLLENCSSVVELPAMENVTSLDILYLNNCSSLLELPPSIGNATKLRMCNISGCSSLVKLPSSIGDCTNLKHFDLSYCSNLVELPLSIGNLQNLSTLIMRGCSKLEALPTNINLESLCTLDLTESTELKSFPEISTNIMTLMLKGTAVKEVPMSIMSWSRLTHFGMSYFESLKELPHALDTITELLLVNEDIQEVPPWFKGMSRLRVLRLYNCNNLVSLPQLSDSLYHIDAENCKSLERLDCSFNNVDIRLHFANCFKLNQEARDLIMHTPTLQHAILPGTQVPACFNHRATAEGTLNIKLIESPLPRSLRFKVCIMLVEDMKKTVDNLATLVWIGIVDKQNNLKVRLTPSFHAIGGVLLAEHLYTFEVEAKEVTSTELVFKLKTSDTNWEIRECGLLQILEVPSC